MITVGYLGPEGTYSHLAAKERYGVDHKLIPLPSITDVFASVSEGRVKLGVVPIENTSGGTIYETVDCFVGNKYPVFIQEDLNVKVNLALVGKKKAPITVLYSHFAPLVHCRTWISKHLPKVKTHSVPSTAMAASMAAHELGAAALSTRFAAKIYGLDVLMYPVGKDVPNRTQFFSIGLRDTSRLCQKKMTLTVTLNNNPGSLLDFLLPFKQNGINLSRILSRPIEGESHAYVFFVDVEIDKRKFALVKVALKAAKSACKSMQCVGVYPINRLYKS